MDPCTCFCRSDHSFWILLKRVLHLVPQLTPLSSHLSPLKKVSQSVWEFYRPNPPEIPKIDVIFFHGLQLSNHEEAFWKTWLSRDEMMVWPKEWLGECFPQARILSVSYDSSARKASGQPDMFIINENLITDLILGECEAGQQCPVVLVGHSFGGLIIKSLVLKCAELKDELQSEYDVDRINKFLVNCKGVFYYSTPHGGSKLADYASLIPGMNESLMHLVKTLSTEAGRINGRFNNLRHKLRITTQAVGESRPTKYMGFEMKVIEEASARQDSDGVFYTVPEADHIDVCKPVNKTTCSSFKILCSFISNVIQNTEPEPEDELPVDFPLPKNFVDDDGRVQLVIKELQLQDPQPLCLAIIGMGGIGKTTVAKGVLIKLSPEFDFVCFVKDVKEETKQRFAKLEELLKGNLYRGRIKVHDLGRHHSLWTFLKGKKVLLVLDDVDSEEQFVDINSRIDHQPRWFGEGTRVIATSRSTQEFPPNFSILQLNFLSQSESSKLFRSHLQANIEQEMPRDVVEKVVKTCDGLPLTLEVIGRYLRCEKNEKIWKSAIDSLLKAEAIGGAAEDKLWTKLKCSFVNLAKREQDMFLDLVAFYDDIIGDSTMAITGFLKAAWASDGDGLQPDQGLRNLVDRCFIRLKPKWSNPKWSIPKDLSLKMNLKRPPDVVWIHEQLRGMAKSIARPLRHKELWRRVWMYNDAEYFLTRHQGSSATEVLRCSVPGNVRIPKVEKLQWSSVARLKDLRILSIKNPSGGQLSIQGSGDRFPSNLSLLSLHGCDSGQTDKSLLTSQDWPIREEDLTSLANLGVLILYESGPVSLPPRFHKLTNLRVLQLERNNLKKLPADFGHLLSLERLTIVRQPQLELLPESFGNLSSLRYLYIRDCRLKNLPQSFGLISGLEEVKFVRVELRELPDNFGELSHLRILSLCHCHSLQRLPDSFWQLWMLQTLVIWDCSKIPSLSYPFYSIGHLSELHILELSNLREVPSSIGMLSHLNILKLGFCVKLENLPNTFGELRALKTLDISSCNSLHTLPISFGKLRALQLLTISECDSLHTLPNSFGELRALENLIIIKCESLHTLPNSFGELWALQPLVIKRCGRLQTLPNSFGELRVLQTLTISICKSLHGLPNSFGELRALQTLNIFNCEMLKTLPDSVGHLSMLKDLTIREVPLKELPGSFGLLSGLQSLKLDRCPNLERLPHNFRKLNSLQRLVICDCAQLKGGVGLPKSLLDVRETSESDDPPKLTTCPFFFELEGCGWVRSAWFEVDFDTWVESEVDFETFRIYKRPEEASTS